jgi:hypothetical protein
MLKIQRIQSKELVYYYCTFLGGNLYAFTMVDLISQLRSIYNIRINLFTFNLN